MLFEIGSQIHSEERNHMSKIARKRKTRYVEVKGSNLSALSRLKIKHIWS